MHAQGVASFSIVNGASYQAAVAPNSIASLFGANLAATAVPATLDASGQLPTQLGGVAVEVDGQASALFYVSPLQINFVVPDGIAAGSATVVVRATDTGATRSGSMLVQTSAPGIFTTDASGKGPGSILNAVTYAGPPFLVETAANGANDLRTRLAVYGTGLRNGSNVQATAQDTNSNRYTLTVEYAGPAPGYFGLDQVNVVLPAELDGAGTVSLNISTDTSTSNIVTFQVGTLPAEAVHITGLSLSAPVVTAGDSVTATLLLNAPARSIGLPVSVRSDNAALQVPLSLTVPAGKASLPFNIAASAVNTVQMATITAQGGGITVSAPLEIDPLSTLQLNSFTVTPQRVQGGLPTTATATLSGSAPVGGGTIQVASDSDVAQPPATVTVAAGSTSASFSIPTSAVTSSQTANLTATFGRTTKTAQVTVAPTIEVTLSNTVVVGGSSVNGTIALGSPAPTAGVTLNVQCDNRTIAQPPLTVNIPAGQSSIGFVISTIQVNVSRTVTISVSYAGATGSATLTVNPVATAVLTGFVIAPDKVTGGTNATGTVTLGAAAPPGGVTIGLVSSAAFIAQTPGFVTVPQGQTSAPFTITTSRVSAAQTVTITATSAGVSKTATVTVQ